MKEGMDSVDIAVDIAEEHADRAFFEEMLNTADVEKGLAAWGDLDLEGIAKLTVDTVDESQD